MSEDKGVGIKGWLSGPKRKEQKPETRTAQTLDKRRLAVLPLSNISADPKDSYFADGMTEELITVLSQLQDLRVIARTSVDHYRGKEKRISQIADELQVGSVIEGSVRMAGERIRVTLQLINATNEEHIWSENYDRRLDDIFAIQTDIAKQVAQALKTKLLEEVRDRMVHRAPENVSAYVNYVKGRGLFVSRKTEEIEKAKELFEKTVLEDPKFAPGYAGLADAYYFLGDYFVLPPSQARVKAKEYVLKALSLDADVAEAHATLGLLLHNEFDFARAREEFEKALKLNPSYSNARLWYAFCLGALGHVEQCLQEMALAEESDPFSIVVLYNEHMYLSFLGRKADAARRMEKLRTIAPDNWLTQDALSTDYYFKGDYEQALKIALEADRTVAGNNPSFKFKAASACAAMGDAENSEKWLAELNSLPKGTMWRDLLAAQVHAALGDVEGFFKCANNGIQAKAFAFFDLRLIEKWTPGARKVRLDPRYAELFRSMNLPVRADID